MTRPLLYIAGPYSHPDPVENTHRAVKVATAIYEQTDWVPLVPHLSLLWHAITPRPVDWWYALDLHLLDRCDALLRLPGESAGADAELAHAVARGLRIVGMDGMPADVIAAAAP